MTIRAVIDGGFCIGCGACSAVAPRIRIDFNQTGDLVAVLPDDVTGAELAAGSAVCPFSAGEDESAIARRVFSGPDARWHDEIGMHVGTHAVFAPAHQARGSSGGVVTWLLAHLLERGLIDFAIHVAPAPSGQNGRFFGYRVSDSAAAVAAGSTSFYYPVSMDEVLQIVGRQQGRYAITGVPCFHKALRRLRAADAVLDARIRYQIGIVCGQMKSAHYLEYLTRRAGADPALLGSACFRRKVAGRPANDYAFEAVELRPGSVPRTATVMNSAIGINWGMGYFKPKACEFCDDVMAETADVAAMDAWLPEFMRDGQGWSLLINRVPALEAEMHAAAASGALVMQPASAAQVAESQRGGLNHRRKGLPYRLWLHRQAWHPPKRASADRHLPWLLRLEQRLREFLRARSRELWLRTGHLGRAEDFRRGMRIGESAYRWLQRFKRRLS